MITSALTVIDQGGMEFSVQTVETTDRYLLIRLRSDYRIPSGREGIWHLAVAQERFTLEDGHGTKLTLEQTVSMSDGPFGGTIDLAFPLNLQIDLESRLTLRSENAWVNFHL